jgi:hypothetical protein
MQSIGSNSSKIDQRRIACMRKLYQRFPELVQLLCKSLFEFDPVINKIELVGSPVAIAEQWTPVEIRPINQSEADVRQRIRQSAEEETFLASERKFEDFFTQEGYLSKAVEILGHIKQHCFDRGILQLY